MRWRGWYIAVDADGGWSWQRCYVCQRALTDPESIARGHGPVCRPDAIKRDQALHADRRRYALALLQREGLLAWTSPATGLVSVVDPQTGEVIDTLDRWVAGRRRRGAA